MSLRRSILLFGPTAVIALGLGLHDWPVDGGRATSFANRALDAYGLALSVQGPASLTLLPTPRLTLDRVRARSAADGPALVDEARLVIDLDLFGLLAGRAEVGGLRLAGGRLSANVADWRGPFARLAERVRSGATAWPRRITVSGAQTAQDSAARDIDLDLARPFWGASAEGGARLIWRGVPTRITLAHLRPTDLALGRRSPFTAEATWPGGSVAIDGTVETAGSGATLPVLAGQMRVETRSLPESLSWIGSEAPLAPLAGAFSVAGSFETADRSISWPRLRIGIGQNVLEGAGAVTLGPGDAPRMSAQATLAADTLDLAPLVGDAARLFGGDPQPLALAPFTRGDLDLRLSATTGRIGPVALQDLAASILVRDGGLEIAVNRARVEDGTVKARVTLGCREGDPDETEMRLQGSLDRVDLGSLLGEFGGARWLVGPVQGQFALESSARDSAGLIAHLGGRAALTVAGGAITGLDLVDVVHRNGAVAPGALARRNGRTAIERAAVVLRFADGIGEITEAGLLGPGVGAAVRGRVSVSERRLDLRGDLALRSPADAPRGLLFEVSGPWSAPTIQTATHVEAPEPVVRDGEAASHEAFGLPAAQGLPMNARAYAP
ncbi:AsmA protein [Methylobacterium phyllostachyos]|uniref:AsmA protein n=1 Tax=Methylobacterium phyllostachyos TaxID=582672 RepID=A0A1H0FCS4_9HYPH|nr:AsmA-like C-terminal region-containing protein [Methylobacterium phyllostachyos]SDN92269.1 AsmA protein [Methylobacterium phyllostachyos]